MEYETAECVMADRMSARGLQRRGETVVRGLQPLSLWDLVADTDLINRALGTPTSDVRYEPEGPGASRRIMTWTLGPHRLTYEEERFQWEVGRWYLIRRELFEGPLARLLYFVRLRGQGEDTLVEIVSGADVRDGASAPDAEALLDEVCMHKPLIPLLDALSGMARPRWVAPGSPVNEPAVAAADRALRDMGEAPKAVERLIDHVRTGLEADLAEMAPLRLARLWGEDPEAIVSCFIRAARLGLLSTQWSIVCPSCRGAKGGQGHAYDLDRSAHCEDCNLSFEADPRQNMQLGFRPAPSVREVVSGRACVGSPTRTPHILVQVYVEAGEDRALFRPPPGVRRRDLRFRCPQRNLEYIAHEPRGIWRLDDTGFTYEGPEDRIVVRNRTAERLRLVLEEPPPYGALLAAEVLEHPGFSALFGAEEWECLAAMTGAWCEGFGVTAARSETLDRAFDLSVVGSGPAGETLAITSSQLGAKVALVERRELFGGPTGLGSKAFREAALKVLSWARMSDGPPNDAAVREAFDARFATFRDHVVSLQSHELMSRLSHAGVCLVRGTGQLDSDGLVVQRDGMSLRVDARRVALAVGSRPLRPSHVPFDGQRVLDAEEISAMAQLPNSIAIVGGGVIACEYASIFGALGVPTLVVHAYDTFLPGLDPGLRDGIVEAARARGVRFLTSVQIEAWTAGTDGVTLALSDGTTVTAERVLYARGREASTEAMGPLVGSLKADKGGFLRVGDDLSTSLPDVFALGDVTGPPGLASAAMAQGRRLAESLFAAGASSSEPPCPTVIWTLPEVASVGQSFGAAGASEGLVAARALFREMPRGLLSGDLHGFLELVVSAGDGAIVGVHILGAGASELIHFGSQLIATGCTCAALARQVFAAVTLHDLFRTAAERAEATRQAS
ncbi:MAG: FAD-dependent oxidoreductase [Myxococcales bacterium]|nr:FAD-dependent oxidoreductase [Myxococcales bacterium]MDD9971438.1 FAD-dependent oxidoreductase [Myxococcales bacterium]